MTILDLWNDGIAALRRSEIVHGALSLLVVLLVVFVFLSLLLLLTFVLRRFVHRDPLINRTHRTLIYLLTMGGATVLIFAGILGIVLPVLPGIVLLVAGFLLLRRYHRWQWLELRIGRLKEKIRVEREMYRIKQERRLRESAALREELRRQKALKAKNERSSRR